MGKVSVKENKKVYQVIREELGLTREQASELIDGMEAYRLNKIENDLVPTPDEVYNMSKAYKKPELCNHYCINECGIGREAERNEIQMKDLTQITLGMLNKLHTMDEKKDELISISADGNVDDEELEEFCSIQDDLTQMAELIETLKLWTEKMIYNGEINEEKYKKYKEKRANLLLKKNKQV